MSALVCDGCDATIIVTARLSGRALLAEAQLNRGAVASGGKVYCRDCRKRRTALTPEGRERAAAAAHSVSTGTAKPAP